MQQTWDIKKLLDWTTGYLRDKGIETARLDAEILLSHVLGLRRLELYLKFDRPLRATELAQFKKLIRRRADQEPVAYIVGKKEFWSREFSVSPAVLIPRPDTEVLVEAVLERFKIVQGPGSRVQGVEEAEIVGFEFGPGSGNIAVTLLAEMAGLKMKAVDASPKAIETAKKNAELHGVAERLTLYCSTTLGRGPWTLEKYDFIVSNPPYCQSSEWERLPTTVRDYEPRRALNGGKDGLRFYRVLTPWAAGHLKEGGFLAVEIGQEQGAAVTALFEEVGFKRVAVKKDYGGLDRVVMGW